VKSLYNNILPKRPVTLKAAAGKIPKKMVPAMHIAAERKK